MWKWKDRDREKKVVYEQTLSFACGAAIISNAYKTVKRGKKAKKQKYENNNTKWLLFESPQQIVWLNFVNLCTICKYVCSAHILKHCKFVDAGQKICRIAYLIFCFFILGT